MKANKSRKAKKFLGKNYSVRMTMDWISDTIKPVGFSR